MSNINLGALKRPKDFRDIQLGTVSEPLAPEIKPIVYKPDLVKYPKLFQGQQPACGAHAGAMLCEILRSIELNLLQQFSPRFLWTEIKKVDGYPISSGTDMRNIFKVLQETGVCDFTLGANNIDLSLQDYANLSITQEMVDNAFNKEISAYAFIDNPTFEQLTDSIYQHQAVLLLLKCDDGFFNTTTPTFTTEKYGHFVVAAGYDSERGEFYIVDSTEEDFSKSVKTISKDSISFVKELGTVVELSETQINNLIKEKELLQQLVVLYQKLLKLLHL